MLDELNATALPRAWDRRVLRMRLRRYMAREQLASQLAVLSDAVAKLGGRAYRQSWTMSIVVGKWENSDVQADRARVVFLAYETPLGVGPTPIERFTVMMHREHGGWKLVAYRSQWLRADGPMDESGEITIRSLPERIVFANPYPAR